MPTTIAPENVHSTVAKHTIADGFPFAFDLERSHGCWIVDPHSGEEYLDFYGFFASLPLGFNHPAFADPHNAQRLSRTAVHKPANSDAETVELASFLDAFAAHALPSPFKHLFFIDGGALAVENALKAAFDWKVRKNMAAGRGEIGTRIAHFAEAFHGRSGYTMSLTNTVPAKIALFPKFDWPRISNPKLRFPITPDEIERVTQAEREAVSELEAAFAANPTRSPRSSSNRSRAKAATTISARSSCARCESSPTSTRRC